MRRVYASVSERRQGKSMYMTYSGMPHDSPVTFHRHPGEYVLDSVGPQDVERYAWACPNVAFSLAAGENKEFNIVLKPMPRLSGIVRDATGEPSPGIRYTVLPWSQMYPTRVSGEAGRIDHPALPPYCEEFKPAVFVAMQPERNEAAIAELTDPAKPIDVKLAPGLALSGCVVDSHGEPVPGAPVNIYLVLPSGTKAKLETSLENVRTVTNEQGRYEFAGLPPGRAYMLWANHRVGTVGVRGLGAVKLDVAAEVAKAGRVELAPLMLRPTDRAISGVLVDADGRAVGGLTVFLNSGEGQQGGHAQTDSEGRFRIEEVCSGQAVLQAGDFKINTSVHATVDVPEEQKEVTGVRLVLMPVAKEEPKDTTVEPKGER